MKQAKYLDGRAALALGAVTAAFRMVYISQIHMARLGGAAWLAILLGASLAGLAALIWRGIRSREDIPRAAWALWPPVLWADGALMIHALTDSASHSVLYALPEGSEALFTAGALLLFGLCGTAALGGAARLYLPVAGVLGILMIWAQRKCLVPGWLFPLLGPGAGEICRCALALAAAALPALLLPAWMEESGKYRDGGKAVLAAGLLAAVVAAANAMAAPYMEGIPEKESFRLEMLLANGRIPLPLQFPALAVWYGAALLTAGCDAAMVRGCLERLFPGMPPLAAGLLAAAVPAAAYFAGCWDLALTAWPLAFPLILIPLAAGAMRKDRNRAAGPG